MRFSMVIEAVAGGKKETPAEWVKRKTGYTMFTGKDHVLDGYVFRGSPSAKHMGIPDWPDEEVGNFHDDAKKRYLADKFAGSKPRVMLVNHTTKQVALLPATAEGGKHDRGHENGRDWAWRHSDSDDWEFVDGNYVYEDVNPKTVEMAVSLGFLEPGDDLVEIMKSGGARYRKTQVGKYLAGKQGKKFRARLTNKAKEFVRLLEEIYRLELDLAKAKEAGSPLLERRLEGAIKSKFNEFNYVARDLDPRWDSQLQSGARAQDIGKAFDRFMEAGNLAHDQKIGEAMAQLSIGKQYLHRYVKEEPAFAAQIFGSKAIVDELSRISAIGD